MTNVQTIQSIYEAFGRGDVAAILSHISEDVAWEQWKDNSAVKAGVPYLVPRRGRAGVAEFFASLAVAEIHDFQVLGFLEGGRHVGVLVEIELTIKATGRRFRDQELHLWTLDERGQVVGMRHHIDTAKHIAASGL